jgi:hypothetical protein
MPWDAVFDKLLEERERSRVILRMGMSLGAALAASMAASTATTKIMRDLNHPQFVGKEAPRSPKPRFKKGR